MSELYELFGTMALVRRFEEALLDLANDGKVPGVIHPYTGHEAVAVGALSGRDPQEWVVGYYRCHGHAIASGVPIGPLLREILDREGGICGGRSGSMQFCAAEHRFLLASSIVGSQISIAAGVAFREKAERSNRAVVVFCGDGALGAGVSYETLMISRRRQLPLVLVCEDNGWQDHTASEAVMPMRPAELLRGLGLAVVEANGNDVQDVASATGNALEQCRAGKGPVAVVAHTYLRDFHSQLRNFRPREYRPEREVRHWQRRDPLELAAQQLRQRDLDPTSELERATETVRRAVDEALAAAPTAHDGAASGVTVMDWSNGLEVAIS